MRLLIRINIYVRNKILSSAGPMGPAFRTKAAASKVASIPLATPLVAAASAEAQDVGNQCVALAAAEREIGHMRVRHGEILAERVRRRARAGGNRREARHASGGCGARFTFDDVAGHAPAFGEFHSDARPLRARRERQQRHYHRYRSSHLFTVGRCRRARLVSRIPPLRHNWSGK